MPLASSTAPPASSLEPSRSWCAVLQLDHARQVWSLRVGQVVVHLARAVAQGVELVDQVLRVLWAEVGDERGQLVGLVVHAGGAEDVHDRLEILDWALGATEDRDEHVGQFLHASVDLARAGGEFASALAQFIHALGELTCAGGELARAVAQFACTSVELARAGLELAGSGLELADAVDCFHAAVAQLTCTVVELLGAIGGLAEAGGELVKAVDDLGRVLGGHGLGDAGLQFWDQRSGDEGALGAVEVIELEVDVRLDRVFIDDGRGLCGEVLRDGHHHHVFAALEFVCGSLRGVLLEVEVVQVQHAVGDLLTVVGEVLAFAHTGVLGDDGNRDVLQVGLRVPHGPHVGRGANDGKDDEQRDEHSLEC